MSELGQGNIAKMRTQLVDGLVRYSLPLGAAQIDMSAMIGSVVKIEFAGVINCVHCNRKTNKSFSQGYCYPCFQKLAQCDSCIVSPEKCHYFEGTCREPLWGEEHCLRDHIVYLSNTSALKIGITRGTQIPTRWIDQGAVQALPIFRVSNRLQSGLVETVFKAHVADKTSWQAMLKAEPEAKDMAAERDRLLAQCQPDIDALVDRFGEASIEALQETETSIRFPVEQYPEKVKSFNLDKLRFAEGTLLGIKGQYLIFDTGVINMRKYGGYQLRLSA
ncbi:MAG: hypothetical protein ACI9OO_000720 [Bacteroidia bacterium]|jgi:hypothetical protein